MRPMFIDPMTAYLVTSWGPAAKRYDFFLLLVFLKKMQVITLAQHTLMSEMLNIRICWHIILKKGKMIQLLNHCCNIILHLSKLCEYKCVTSHKPSLFNNISSVLTSIETNLSFNTYIRRFNKKQRSNSSNTLFKLYFRSTKSLWTTIGHFSSFIVFHSW